jgi:DNA-binding CsgD family transcriptional regulator
MSEGTRAAASRLGTSQLRDSHPPWPRGARELGASGKFSGTEGFPIGFVDQRQVGLFGLSGSGVVVESNERGREILRRDGGLRVEDGCLRAQRTEDAGALEGLLESVLGDTDGRGGGRTTVGRWPDQRPLTVYVSRVDGGQVCIAALIVVVDPWQPTRLSPEQVARSLRLTPAESRVAVALAEGSTTGQIAEATGRAVHTVRWLVQRALEKTYCSRQADLVRLVLLSSHLPVAQWE